MGHVEWLRPPLIRASRSARFGAADTAIARPPALKGKTSIAEPDGLDPNKTTRDGDRRGYLSRRPGKVQTDLKSPRILFLSNGHGEDTVGAEIARQLREREPGYDLVAVPIVGLGEPYRENNIPIAGRTEIMPSGGLIYAGRRAVWRDVKHGVLGLLVDQIQTLRSLAPHVDLVVGVGDKVILYLDRWFLRRPMFFVGVAYSAYYSNSRPAYGRGLRRILGTFSPTVYARDERTAAQLRGLGVSQATFVGNPMMDCFEVSDDALGVSPGHDIVGILPGSREEAYGNLKLILRGIDRLRHLAQGRRVPLAYVVALSANLDVKQVSEALAEDGWQQHPGNVPEPGPGVVATLASKNGTIVRLARGRFGDVISRAVIIVGLSGTANEQAAGLGKPIVTFPGTGEQTPPRFVRSQRRLLGEAVHITEPIPEIIARDALALLNDPARREQMGRVGKIRMGAPGAINRIVDDIRTFVTNTGARERPDRDDDDVLLLGP